MPVQIEPAAATRVTWVWTTLAGIALAVLIHFVVMPWLYPGPISLP